MLNHSTFFIAKRVWTFSEHHWRRVFAWLDWCKGQGKDYRIFKLPSEVQFTQVTILSLLLSLAVTFISIFSLYLCLDSWLNFKLKMLDCTILSYLLSMPEKKRISVLQGMQNEKILCEGLKHLNECWNLLFLHVETVFDIWHDRKCCFSKMDNRLCLIKTGRGNGKGEKMTSTTFAHHYILLKRYWIRTNEEQEKWTIFPLAIIFAALPAEDNHE